MRPLPATGKFNHPGDERRSIQRESQTDPFCLSLIFTSSIPVWELSPPAPARKAMEKIGERRNSHPGRGAGAISRE